MSDASKFEPALAQIALRRYPGKMFAVEMLMSDRRAAGLGALNTIRRRRRGEVYAHKYRDEFRGTVCYRWGVDSPPRREIPRLDLSTYYPNDDDAQTLTVTVIEIPARVERWAGNFDCSLFNTQNGRTAVARELRRGRRDARAGKISKE